MKCEMKVRCLPGQKGILVSKDQYPSNCVLLNPSATDDYVCIRCISRKPNQPEVNSMIMFNDKSSTSHHVHSPMGMLQPTINMYTGLEDARIVNYNGRIWFTATCTHATANMTSEMVLGYLDKSCARVEFVYPIDLNEHPLKNICPFVHNDELHIIDVYRLRIYKVQYDESNAEVPLDIEPIITLNPGALEALEALGSGYEKLRGSTSPVHLHGNIWGCVAHDIIYNDDATPVVSRLAYMHYWLEFDISVGTVTFVSSPFWISRWGIEYVSGIRKEDTNNIELYYGVDDCIPMKCITNLANLRIGKGR